VTSEAPSSAELPWPPIRSGKVRDLYAAGDHLLLVASDRISAFDVVLPTPIPGKGRILTALSKFWFDRLAAASLHHLVAVIDDSAPPPLDRHLDRLRGRAMLCLKAEVVPIECVVRGYLAGSGWKEYAETGKVCGIALPPGLRRCERLPQPIFTPASKADVGHDENISFERACDAAGGDAMREQRARSLRLYSEAAAYALDRGVIIADTKFEFGRRDGALLLIDEVLTPDSSRFWPAARYEAGREPPSFDKQFVRDYLKELISRGAWDRNPPGPELPPAVVEGTAARYREAHRLLTGRII
jgi:phosphoribosylaminoimidazole-succinocarboxamide synthase